MGSSARLISVCYFEKENDWSVLLFFHNFLDVQLKGTVPLETMGPFAVFLPRSNRGFDLQFHLGKTPSYRIKNLGFT